MLEVGCSCLQCLSRLIYRETWAVLKVILGHSGCTVAKRTKEMECKLAQAMDKVYPIKLSIVQVHVCTFMC